MASMSRGKGSKQWNAQYGLGVNSITQSRYAFSNPGKTSRRSIHWHKM